MALITTDAEIADLRTSGRILADTIELVAAAVKPGVTTKELDAIAMREIRQRGGQPAFLGYQGFPAALCTSINTEVVHGIPNQNHVLQAGDIVGLDLGVAYKGMYTDHAITVAVGDISSEAQQLLSDTEASLMRGLQMVKAGGRVGDISAAIEKTLKPKKYGIVRDLTGHGVGRAVHEPPSIPNFGAAGSGPKLEAGMVLAIEPMVTLGDWRVETRPDGWTVATADGSLAAHFEHTVLVTQDGYELLTGHGKNTRN